MADPTNDIDALAAFLLRVRNGDDPWCDPDQAKDWSRALTALVAERDAIRSELEGERQRFVKHLEDASRVVQTWPTWKQEVLGGTAVQPPADRDRDLRERLVCAIWPEIMRQWREYKDAIDPRGCARSDALEEVNKMLAAMRKGGGA